MERRKPEIELAVPGVDAYLTWLDGGYANQSSTSMAAPFVSGVAALIKSKNPAMTPGEVRDALANAGRDGIYGLGLVQTG